MHDVDGEMHLLGMCFQARRDGIQARLQFRQGVHKFLRCPFYGWMLDQEVDDLHAPQVTVEIQFALGLE